MPVKRKLPAKIGRCSRKLGGHNFDFSNVLGGYTPIMRLSTVLDQVRKWIPKRRDKSAILMKMRKRISKICNSQTVDLDLQFSWRGGGGDGAPWFCTLTNQILVPTVFASHLCLFVFVNLSLSLSCQLSVSPLCLHEWLYSCLYLYLRQLFLNHLCLLSIS